MKQRSFQVVRRRGLRESSASTLSSCCSDLLVRLRLSLPTSLRAWHRSRLSSGAFRDVAERSWSTLTSGLEGPTLVHADVAANSCSTGIAMYCVHSGYGINKAWICA